MCIFTAAGHTGNGSRQTCLDAYISLAIRRSPDTVASLASVNAVTAATQEGCYYFVLTGDICSYIVKYFTLARMKKMFAKACNHLEATVSTCR